MKIFNLLTRLGLAAALTTLTITVANADTIDGTAIATVIAPLSIVEDSTMNFGSLSGGPLLGTVILNVSGGRTTTGDAQILGAGAGSAAAFTITGASGQAYSLSYTAGTLSDGSGNTMAVDTFTDDASGSLTGATESFAAGATLHVGVDQTAGAYSTAAGGGSAYSITVNYN